MNYQNSFNDLKNEVTIFLFSYNFEKSIQKSLNNILSQIISIPIKVYCIDDGSNDGTQKILKKNSEKNKNIKLILSSTNTKLPLSLLFKSNIDFNSKYFCLLDGDDYWIDDYNLQKKIDILNNDERIIGCSSITKMISEDDVALIKADKKLFNKTDMCAYGNIYSFYCHTSSLLWKNYYYNKKTKLPFPPHVGQKGQDGDTFLFNQMLNKNHLIYVIQEVLSIYNYNNKGAWSSLPKEVQDEKNKILRKKIFYYSPFKYKILYVLTFFSKFIIFKKNKIYKFFFKILRTKPVNIL
jgi:glycosyltransferase involved in cell wall biosynthesis